MGGKACQDGPNRVRPLGEDANVPNDAKLGLVLGVGLVIAVGVVFFRKDLVTPRPNEIASGAVVRPADPPAEAVRNQLHPVRAHTAERTAPPPGDVP
jgi:hypothetical protein